MGFRLKWGSWASVVVTPVPRKQTYYPVHTVAAGMSLHAPTLLATSPKPCSALDEALDPELMKEVGAFGERGPLH